MGLHEKSTPLNNELGISKGAVAQRRAELIAAKFSGYAGIMPNKVPVVKPLAGTPIESGKALSHPTRSRPVFSHRPPSRRKDTRVHFFAEKVENSNELTSPPLAANLAGLLKKAISDAERCYREHYQNGSCSRQPNGWFSWWRHGAAGQEKAGEVCVTAQEEDTCDSLLDKMRLFFDSPETRYNNHSFASYLLDELDKLLHHFSLPGCKVEEGAYDKDSWFAVAVQLGKIVPVAENGDALVMS
ncbi:hypothetical protein [Legionella maioricensis]|uniref:Uncharacterized protein n=1 Tax=Legionella maioricensis TaxID=2896528 RepID=A0A9X2D1Y4_9GAMM|nr:hypothetical protein [Legionella maioricensis]MCL9684931.1 hypothetical protein [Legionella maioricensis]MCL9688237.1 hypothetical protein [Legionella maioricensis]